MSRNEILEVKGHAVSRAGVLLLVMTAIWLCFFHGDEAKEPDGTLVFSITREVAA